MARFTISAAFLSITDYRIAVIIGEEKREFATVMARIAVSVEKSRGQVSDPGLNQRPVPLISFFSCSANIITREIFRKPFPFD